MTTGNDPLSDLNYSGSSRSTTPTGWDFTRRGQNTSNTKSPEKKYGHSPEKRSGYRSFEPGQDSDWIAADEVDEDDEQILALDDDDEDEFGLPSISTMKRKSIRYSKKKITDPGGGGGGSLAAAVASVSLGPSPVSWTSDNGDIAEERNIPSYPLAKKAEGKILRPQYKDILRDPINSLNLICNNAQSNNVTPGQETNQTRMDKINRFKRILQSSTISMDELRSAAWSGVPAEVRPITWQTLLGYLPTNSERRVATLERKRREYLEGVRQAFEKGPTSKKSDAARRGSGRDMDEAVWHQISIDVPRTNPQLQLYSYEATQRSLERILYVWALRHPASGYVQGINDLVTPFWQVFLGAYMTDANVDSGMDPGQLPKQVLDAVEADSYWCLTKLLEDIQDNYIAAQPGIQRQVAALRDLTTRIDEKLARHFESEQVEFIQFSFRWMNCLLMREISVKNTIRMWDTYLVSSLSMLNRCNCSNSISQAEDQGFSQFHLYVCAAFLVKWSEKLMTMDFQEIMMFLQALPTRNWTEKDIELLLSEAFIWQSLYQDSKAHIKKSRTSIGPITL